MMPEINIAPNMIYALAYLTGPEGDKGPEGEPGIHSGSPHLGESGAHGDRESTIRAGLDLDLGHLPRAKSDIGEELSRGGSSQPDGTLVLLAGLLAGEVHVGIFEDLVETVLEGTLEGVANQGRSKALPSTRNTLLGDNGSKTRYDTLVLAGVDLQHAKRGMGQDKNAVRTTGASHTCMLHLATSRGVIPAWVVPQAKTPPRRHFE
jgi:hypothetical protein